MTDWLLQQQGPLSVALLLLIALEHFATARIGIKLMYRLWLIVPVTLLVNNLPSEVLSVSSDSFTRYVVGMSPAFEVSQNDLLFTLWATGTSIIASLIVFQYWQLARSVTRPEPGDGNVWISQLASTPMLFGFVAPKILLPRYFTERLSQAQQQLVIEHEHTHMQRFDHVWNLVALVIATLFWFNPLVWLATRSYRINQELACDSLVLRNKSETEKLLYAKALVTCAEHTSFQLTTYPTFGEKSTMIKRLNLISEPLKASKVVGVAAIATFTLLIANTALANLPGNSVKADKVNLAVPVKRVAPLYPPQAAEQNIEGSVVLQFDITETGATDNITIVEAKPEGVFGQNAIKALKQWQYKPRIQGGKAQRQTGILVQLDFKLDNDTAANDAGYHDAEKINVAKSK
ncbi:M56 family metallopeptidase [Alteromonas lipolytica]|uniref:Protein TonB n=1 Tax=Alteromonas lipolytica TaxID=1856405 RepID=A0A1E8FDY5_9ALTE|nr:M56 family metallopeptidase [Alteromonas lipolytica]OFI34144.1 energy transducer TonB [Alteromonas lipolytica]GGF65011.1 protein TonB [Alteromonas lipolytica]